VALVGVRRATEARFASPRPRRARGITSDGASCARDTGVTWKPPRPILQEKPPAPRNAYRGDFQASGCFAPPRGVDALPAHPETVAAYLGTKRSGIGASTITRRCATIRYAHHLADFEPCGASGAPLGPPPAPEAPSWRSGN
jgi:hypothetical protein